MVELGYENNRIDFIYTPSIATHHRSSLTSYTKIESKAARISGVSRIVCRLPRYWRSELAACLIVMYRPNDWPERIRFERKAQLRSGVMYVPYRCTLHPRSRNRRAYDSTCSTSYLPAGDARR